MSLAILFLLLLAVLIVVEMERKRLARLEATVQRFHPDAIADSIKTLNHRTLKGKTDLAAVRNQLRMHSSQLKGAGERIRTIEGRQAADSRTLDSILWELDAIGMGEESTEVQRHRSPETQSDDVKQLRAQVLGGKDVNGLPIVGAVSELRQQVEGINTNLANSIKALAKQRQASMVNIAWRVANQVLEQRKPSWASRAWSWLKNPLRRGGR